MHHAVRHRIRKCRAIEVRAIRIVAAQDRDYRTDLVGRLSLPAGVDTATGSNAKRQAAFIPWRDIFDSSLQLYAMDTKKSQGVVTFR